MRFQLISDFYRWETEKLDLVKCRVVIVILPFIMGSSDVMDLSDMIFFCPARTQEHRQHERHIYLWGWVRIIIISCIIHVEMETCGVCEWWSCIWEVMEASTQTQHRSCWSCRGERDDGEDRVCRESLRVILMLMSKGKEYHYPECTAQRWETYSLILQELYIIWICSFIYFADLCIYILWCT